MYQTPFNSITHEQLEEAISVSGSVKDVLTYFGWSLRTTNYERIARIAENFKLSLPKFKRSGNMIPLELVLVAGSTYNRTTLKRRLIKELGWTDSCMIKGCPSPQAEWNNLPLVLQLDHINGVSDDNRIENLRIICPNCHTQTLTYCNKKNLVTLPAQVGIDSAIRKSNLEANKTLRDEYLKSRENEDPSRRSKLCPECTGPKSYGGKLCGKCREGRGSFKIKWPSDEDIYKMLSVSNFRQVSMKLGVSDNAVRKHLKLI